MQPGHFVDEMEQHSESWFSGIFSHDISRSQVEQRGPQLGAHCVDQHVFAGSVCSSDEHWTHRRPGLMYLVAEHRKHAAVPDRVPDVTKRWARVVIPPHYITTGVRRVPLEWAQPDGRILMYDTIHNQLFEQRFQLQQYIIQSRRGLMLNGALPLPLPLLKYALCLELRIKIYCEK